MSFSTHQFGGRGAASVGRRRRARRPRGCFEPLEQRLLLSVTPMVIDLALAPGESVSETVIITVPESPEGDQQPVDVLFLVDVSGSFLDDFHTLAADAQSIAAGIGDALPDTRFGLATFGEYGAQTAGEPASFPYFLGQALTTDVEQFQDSVEHVRDNSSFGAGVEPHYSALWGAIGNGWEDPADDDEVIDSLSEFSAMDPGWRDDAIKLIVLWTDEAFGDPDVNSAVPGPSGSDVIPALQQFGAKVIGVTGGGGGREDLERVAQATGTLNEQGEPLVLTVDRAGTQLKDEIIAAASVIRSQTSVTLVPFDDSLGLTTLITPVGSSTVPRAAGGTVEFNVTFTLGEDAEELSDTFQLRALGDGVVDLGTVTVNQRFGLPPGPDGGPDPTPDPPPPDDTPPGPEDDRTEVELLIIGAQPPNPGTVGSTFGAQGGGSRDLTAQQPLEERLLDEAFAEDFSSLMELARDHLEENEYDQVLVLLAETDVPDAIGYELGDETAGRRAQPTVAAVALDDLPLPERPALETAQDVVRGQNPPPWHTYALWSVAAGSGAFVVWEAARRWLHASRGASAHPRYGMSQGGPS